MKFGFIYALPGFTQAEFHEVSTPEAGFVMVAVDYASRDDAVSVAQDLVDNHQVDAIELCGGLANATLVAKIKAAIDDRVPVGAVFYGPESRRPLVDLLGL